MRNVGKQKTAKAPKPTAKKSAPTTEVMGEDVEGKMWDIPKTLGACADKLFELREKYHRLEREAGNLRAHSNAIQEHLIEELPKDSAEGIVGKRARATVTMKRFPTVADWGKFYKYISKNKAFELLQRRVSEAAVKERWEAGKQVPGVEPFNKAVISVTKR